ncbi:MAG: transcription antitermination protein NusB [Oscillospiraceae bacterium]|jgi:N utilization substance protein B|nr:transcription antitermination protein NusB [Oscillospiraceae bacterium]
MADNNNAKYDVKLTRRDMREGAYLLVYQFDVYKNTDIPVETKIDGLLNSPDDDYKDTKPIYSRIRGDEQFTADEALPRESDIQGVPNVTYIKWDFSDIIAANKECFGLITTRFTEQLAKGVWDNLPELDGIIAKYSPKRAVSRLPKVSLAVLRLALYELKYRLDVPPKVAVNEGLELFKEYYGEDGNEIREKGFVNAVLGSFIREQDAQTIPENTATATE